MAMNSARSEHIFHTLCDKSFVLLTLVSFGFCVHKKSRINNGLSYDQMKGNCAVVVLMLIMNEQEHGSLL